MVEELDPAIPVFAALRSKMISELGCIDRFGHWQMASSEHLEELIVLQFANRSGLEFQQSVLPRIHIDGIDVSCTCKKIVKGIATCRTDH